MRRDSLFLNDIINSMDKISKYTKGLSEKQFKKNEMLIDAVLRNIEIIGEASNKVSNKIRHDYDDVPWSKMIGLRNIVIHEYFGVDLGIIWEVVNVNLPETKPKIEKILKDYSL